MNEDALQKENDSRAKDQEAHIKNLSAVKRRVDDATDESRKTAH